MIEMLFAGAIALRGLIHLTRPHNPFARLSLGITDRTVDGCEVP